jgi:hypothetical protein
MTGWALSLSFDWKMGTSRMATTITWPHTCRLSLMGPSECQSACCQNKQCWTSSRVNCHRMQWDHTTVNPRTFRVVASVWMVGILSIFCNSCVKIPTLPVVPELCHETCAACEVPHTFLKLSTIWRWMLLPLFTWGKSHRYPLEMCMGGPICGHGEEINR